MNVLIIGSGGREHALAWKIAQSPDVNKFYAAPGNAGIAAVAKCVDIAATNVKALVTFARQHRIGVTIVGPEAPLAAGIVDAFEEANLRIFGPTSLAARLESSKVFAKEVMMKAGVPTATGEFFSDPAEAKEYIRKQTVPLVIKADGLAQGKGVVVAQTTEEAERAITSIMEDKAFGAAGERVLIEECLAGEEVSILVLCDGETLLPLASSQDHKRAFDNDEGPNTGGMGAYSPAPIISEQQMKKILTTIIRPTVAELTKIGCPYKGVLYAGLMMTTDGPKVLEYNIRFGDPETQVVLPRLETDLLKAVNAVIDGELHKIKLSWRSDSCVCVVLASGGYPGTYRKGKVISGLDACAREEGVIAFHAGTAKQDGNIITNGGRVLGITALGGQVDAAIQKAYQVVDAISFEGMHFRRDIGMRALQHMER